MPRVDQNDVGFILQTREMFQQSVLLVVTDVRQLVQARRPADNPQPLRAALDNVLEAFVSAEDVRDVVLTADVHHEVEVAEGDIRIQQQHALLGSCQAQREIGADIGLAYASLTAGHGQDTTSRATAL
jgi:hypothetical protein